MIKRKLRFLVRFVLDQEKASIPSDIRPCSVEIRFLVRFSLDQVAFHSYSELRSPSRKTQSAILSRRIGQYVVRRTLRDRNEGGIEKFAARAGTKID